MAPTITTNDLIVVKVTKNVGVDDVITFEDGDILVTHRIIDKTAQGFITKGDANNIVDDEIIVNDIVGKVVYSGGILNFIFMLTKSLLKILF